MRKFFFIFFAVLLLTGLAGAVSNTYTKSGTLTYQTSPTITLANTYDSSKITHMNISVTPTYAHVNPDNMSGLVAWFKMNDGSGTTVLNSVNPANNASITAGHGTWTTNGKHNSGITYNTLQIGGFTDPLLNKQEGTVIVWAKKTSSQTNHGGLFCDFNASAGGNNYALTVYNASLGTVRFYCGNGGASYDSITTANGVDTNNGVWHMYAGVWNNTTKELSVYVDTTKTTKTSTSNLVTNSYPVAPSIGYYSLQDAYINGTMDDAMFFNRSLSQTEINQIYYNTLQNMTVKSNADASSSGEIASVGSNVQIPYNAGDGSVSSIIASVPINNTVDGMNVTDYGNTTPPVTYNFSLTSSEEFTPISSFTGTPLVGTRPHTVVFTDATSNFATSYSWNFGDGSTSTDQNPTHIYSNRVRPFGTRYNVSLTVTNGQGSNVSTRTNYVMVNLAIGDEGTLNTSRRIAVYLENTSVGIRPIAHDIVANTLFHEYNLSYLFNDTIAGNLSTTNYDLLVTQGGFTNATAQVINNYIDTGGNVWFIADPLNESSTYMTNFTNVNYNLPANRFYCLGGLSQPSIAIGQVFSVNNSDPATAFMPASITASTTGVRSTNCRNLGGTNAYGFTYNELIYAGTANCVLAKITNSNTGSRIVYSNIGDFVSGGSRSYFNATTGATLFNNMKAWALGLDNNTMQASVTLPKGDKQFIMTFDDPNGKAIQIVPGLYYFTNMTQSFPYPLGITLFMSPGMDVTPGSLVTGYAYYNSFGYDTNTIHPHQPTPAPTGMGWSTDTASLVDIQSNMSGFMTNVTIGTQNPNFAFYSIRFPGTGTNNTSSLAAANLGLKLASDYGPATHMGTIGDSNMNTQWLPHQKIIYEHKTNMLEIECPTFYDLDEVATWGNNTNDFSSPSAASHWQSALIAEVPNFLSSDFPSVFTLNAHYQSSMVTASLIDVVRNILWYTDNQTKYTNYIDMATLARYQIPLQQAQIKSVTSSNTITTTITTATPIENFTMKFININNGINVQYDGADLDVDNVIYEDGAYYVFHNIATGTHTLTVTDEAVTGAYDIYISKANAPSLKIKGTDYKVINNAWNTSHATVDVNNLYLNCINVLQNGQNDIYVPNHTAVVPLPATFTPTGGSINVTITAWNQTYKRWNESSETHDTTTLHIMGDFPVDSPITIIQNGVSGTNLMSNSTGYVAWNYTGGYSDQEFEAEVVLPIEIGVYTKLGGSGQLNNFSINVTGATATGTTGLLGNITSILGGGYSLATLIIVIIAAAGILRYLGFW